MALQDKMYHQHQILKPKKGESVMTRPNNGCEHGYEYENTKDFTGISLDFLQD